MTLWRDGVRLMTIMTSNFSFQLWHKREACLTCVKGRVYGSNAYGDRTPFWIISRITDAQGEAPPECRPFANWEGVANFVRFLRSLLFAFYLTTPSGDSLSLSLASCTRHRIRRNLINNPMQAWKGAWTWRSVDLWRKAHMREEHNVIVKRIIN